MPRAIKFEYPPLFMKAKVYLIHSLSLHLVSKKKKEKGFHFDLISYFAIFLPKSWGSLKKHIHQNEIICGIFKGGPRQLPHSPHPISTTDSMAFCQNTKISRHTLILFTAHSLENPDLNSSI